MENTNPEHIVDLDMAKKLKRQGYDKPCEYYYLDQDVPFVPKGLKKTKNGEVLNHNGYDEFIYSAPTIDEALEYLMGQNKKFIEKIIRNSFYEPLPAPYVFHNPKVAEEISKEAERIGHAMRNMGNLIVVGEPRPHLHHYKPTSMPSVGLIHDTFEDKIGDIPNISEKIIRKKLDLTKIVVSLPSNIKTNSDGKTNN